MSLFDKLLGRETAAQRIARAESALADGQPGIAKLELERALDRADDPALRADIEARILSCRDAIAEGRMAAAEKFVSDDRPEDAFEEASGAAEVAATPEVRARAELLATKLRSLRVSRGAVAVREPTRSERIGAITAGFDDARTTEYEPVLELVLDGLLAMEDGHFEHARTKLEAAAAATTARYLHRDVANARWACSDLDGADAAFRAFFEAMKDSEDERALFEAHGEHARLLDEAGRIEDAMVAIETALDHVGDDPRGFVSVARFFREHGYLAEAEEVLSAALTLPGAEHDAWPEAELAMVEAALGKAESARNRLERLVLGIRMTGREPPREIEAARARLLDEVDPAHAADLHRRLANSGDDGLAFEEALLAVLAYDRAGRTAEATRMRERAEALARDHVERREAVKALRAPGGPQKD